jgi:phage terminase large subunit
MSENVRVGEKGWARPYQRELAQYFLNQPEGARAMEIWHRRAGKDRIALWIESALAQKRVGLYWHALPEFAHARRVIWDAITNDGRKLIDVNFPEALVAKKNNQEMKIELKNGSIWQLVGSDNFDSLVGSNPVHVTFSEYALASPRSWDFIRPILAENHGSALFITTPRGYNHAHEMWEYAKTSPLWHTSLLTVSDTGVIDAQTLSEERRTMADELYRQEYECDWSAANIGAILGHYVEQAEKAGRIGNIEVDRSQPIEISSDLGFRDTACWWFWQPKFGGFSLVDYDDGVRMDAEDWIERLKAKAAENGYTIRHIWLPHDSKAKTFGTKHSPIEQFLKAFGGDIMRIVPDSKIPARINAARVVMPHCEFHATNCAEGLKGLRAWSFEYDDEKHVFSREPRHDWASHPGDAFSYGAQIMQERIAAKKDEPVQWPVVGTQQGFQIAPLETLWREQGRKRERV